MVQEEGGHDIVLDLRQREKQGLLQTKMLEQKRPENKKQNKSFEELDQIKDILQNCPIVIFNWKNEENWPVEYVSENVLKLTGYTEEEFKEGLVCYSDIIHPEDLVRVTEEVKTNSEDADVHQFEHEPYRIVTKDGAIRWVQDFSTIKRNLEGKITNYKGIIQDITDFNNLKNKFEKNQNLSHLLLENTSDCIWRSDIHLNFTYVNPAIQQLFGYSPEEWIGTNILEHIDEEKLKDLQKEIESEGSLDAYSNTLMFDSHIVHKDGRKIPVEVAVKILRDESGIPVGFQGSTRNISKRKKTEDLLFLRFQIQKLISSIASLFITKTDFDTSVLGALQMLGTFTQADATFIFLVDSQGKISTSHDWCKEGIQSRKEELQNIDFSLFPWSKKQLEQGNIVAFSDTDPLPEEATAESEFLRQYGVNNQLMIPIILHQKYRGVVSINDLAIYDKLNKEDIENLSIISVIFANAFHRYQIEQKIKEKEKQYRMLSETIPVAVYSLELTAPYQIDFITDMISEISGYKKDEFIKTTLLDDLIFLDESKNILEIKAECISKKEVFNEEYRIKTKQGKTVWIKDRFNPLLNSEGNIVQINGFLEDISLRKEFEGNLQEKIVQLQRYKKVTVGRELKMIELKKQNKKLQDQIQEKPRTNLHSPKTFEKNRRNLKND